MAVAPAGAATGGSSLTASHALAVTPARAAGPALSAPDIALEPCTSARATWVHITLAVGDQPAQTLCWGYTGTWYFSANKTTHFCAGNNYGTLNYYTASGEARSLGFLPGYKASEDIDVVSLTIKGWRGSDTC
jgi:hypothetical protein